MFLVLVVKGTRTRTRDSSNASAFASAGESPNGRSPSSADSDAFGSVHVASMANGVCAAGACALTGSSLGCIVRLRVVHHGSRIDLSSHTHKRPRGKHQSE